MSPVYSFFVSDIDIVHVDDISTSSSPDQITFIASYTLYSGVVWNNSHLALKFLESSCRIPQMPVHFEYGKLSEFCQITVSICGLLLCQNRNHFTNITVNDSL